MYNSSDFICYAFDLKRFRLTYEIHVYSSSYAWKLDQLAAARRLRRITKKAAKKHSKERRFSLKNKHIYLGTYLWRNSPYHNEPGRLEQ